MGKELILVGGGHAHLTILKQLRQFSARGHRVTLVSPSPFHDYSGLGPGLLSGKVRLTEARFNIARMVSIRGGLFIEAAATEIDPEQRKLLLDNGRSLTYDVISFNSGSTVTLPMPKAAIGKTIFPVKPIANLFHARQKIVTTARTSNNRLRLLVIGGGPSGCEVTGNLQSLIHNEKIAADIIQIAGTRLLNRFPVQVRNQVRTLLAGQEFQLHEGLHVNKLTANRAELDDNRTLDFDFAFVASGISATGPFLNSPLSGEKRAGLIVNQFLQAPNHPEIFGGGDCVNFQNQPLDKVGVHAVRQGPVLRHNIMAALEKKKLQRFQPQSKYLLIFNLGLGRSVATGYGLCWSGYPALWLKTLLDSRFIKKFQELG